jgi:hypothetical protein
MTDYCAESDIETYLGIEIDASTVPTTSQLATIISDVSRTLDDMARGQISGLTTGEIEYFDVNIGLDTIVVSKRPLSSVTSIVKIESDGSESSSLTQGRARDGSAHYWVQDDSAGIIRFHHSFSTSIRDYLKVTYSHGSSTIPHDARHAAILMTCARVIRAQMLDENCTDRVRAVLVETLKPISHEMNDAIKAIKAGRNVGVGILG